MISSELFGESKIARVICLFFNRFVNEIFGNLFNETFGRRNTSLDFKPKKFENDYFLLQNRHLKTKIDCKRMGNGNFKHVFLGNMILYLKTY